jgi:hypothetical protein
MGTIIKFPDVARSARERGGARKERRRSATVIILPVIRIERYTDEPSVSEAGRGQRRRRRRRASRS